jgi:hypothetical protein
MGEFGLACGGLVARRRVGYRERCGWMFFPKRCECRILLRMTALDWWVKMRIRDGRYQAQTEYTGTLNTDAIADNAAPS